MRQDASAYERQREGGGRGDMVEAAANRVGRVAESPEARVAQNAESRRVASRSIKNRVATFQKPSRYVRSIKNQIAGEIPYRSSKAGMIGSHIVMVSVRVLAQVVIGKLC